MISRIVFLLVATLLAGCSNTKGLTSIEGGESKVFEEPPYVVLGKTQYDQNTIDDWVEGGVAAFGWKRPAPRPAEIDKAPPPKVAAAPVKKKGFIRRAKERVKNIWPKAAAAPVMQAPVPIPVPVAAAPPDPQPAPALPRDAVDELLDPTPMPIQRRVN